MNEISKNLGSGRSIGAVLIDSGHLSAEQAESVLKLQKERGLRFGDAAIELGYLSEQDIQKALSSQYSYPYLMPGDERVGEEIVAAYKPFSPVVESLRALRSQLMLRCFETDQASNALAIVSPESGEGRSFVAANLAVVFSQLGERTLLIDADLRKPRQHQLFKIPNKVGLSGVLAGRHELSEAIVRIPGLMDISVLPSGAEPPNPHELLSRTAFSEMLAKLSEQYKVILLDTSAGEFSSDCFAVAARAKAALLVAHRNVSNLQVAKGFTRSLQHAGVNVVGSVLNTRI